MNIAERIIELRQLNGISTNKLANKAGISQSYLRDIELGNKNPTVEILSYICFALNISLSDFFSVEKSNICTPLLSAVEKLSQEEQMKLAEFLISIKRNK